MIFFTFQFALLARMYFINTHKQEQYTCSNKWIFFTSRFAKLVSDDF